MVVFSSGGNLKAMAQRGALAVKPSSAWMGEVVDLHDDAVDVVIKVTAMLQRVLAEFVHRRLAIHHADVGIDREAGRAQPFQKLVLARDVELRGLGDGVNKRRKITLRRD